MARTASRRGALGILLICLGAWPVWPAWAGGAAVEGAAAGGAAASGAAVDDAAQVILVRRGWHVDIGFAVAALQGPLGTIAVRDFAGARYLFFGFGDLRYLLSKHRNGPVLLEALWPGRALILATAIAGRPEDAFGAHNVVRLEPGAAAHTAIEHFVLASFQHAPDAVPTRYAPGPYEGSAYYLATARYSALHTCNTWVAESLAAGGLRIHAHGILFAGQLWHGVRRLERAQPGGGG
jgi:hypothetical protein